MSKITASSDLSQVTPQDLPRYCDIFAQDVVDTVNGKLDFSTNFACVFVTMVFGVADTDTSAAHSLGIVPNGYIQIGQTHKIVAYDGTIANTSTLLTLRSSGVGTIRLLVF